MSAESLFERSAVPLDLTEPIGGAPGQWQNLPFQTVHQAASEWCWIALTVSIWGYYNPMTPMEQCVLANRLLAQMGVPGCNQDIQS